MHSSKTGNMSGAQAFFFQIRTIEVRIGLKNNSSLLDFEIFKTTLTCFSSPLCNFWLVFTDMFLHFLCLACHILNDKKLFGPISQNHTSREFADTNHHIISKNGSINLIFISNLSWKCAPYNDTKNLFYPRCRLFSGLVECITFASQGKFLWYWIPFLKWNDTHCKA